VALISSDMYFGRAFCAYIDTTWDVALDLISGFRDVDDMRFFDGG